MATLYNKTALNKIKKAELIQMFLDQQAKLNDVSLDGWMATLEEYKMLKVENKKLKEEACDYESMRKHRDTLLEESEERFMKIHNLEEELEGWKEAAGTYSIDSSDELEFWLSASIHEDDEIYSKYMEPLELRDEVEKFKELTKHYEENKKLLQETVNLQQKQIDKLKKQIGYNDTKIARQNWQIDHAYKQLNELMSKATLLKDEIESKEESDSESEEEEDECVCCGTNFDQHEARYNKGEDLRLKYQKYFGSENDDGDICPECLEKSTD